jgi:hypothetical protein
MATKRTKPKKPAKPVLVQSLVNPALKKRWDTLSKVVSAAAREESEDFDRKWEAVGEILFADPPLYLAGGFTTDKDFFEKFVQVDASTGLRRARVAKYASPPEIERYGDTKIDAVLDYLEAKTGGPLKDRLPIALGEVRVPVVVDKKTSRLSLAEATREQLRAAIRALKQKDSGDTKASPRGAALLKAFQQAGVKVDVSLRRTSFDLRGVSFDDVKKVGQALASVKLPPVPTPK